MSNKPKHEMTDQPIDREIESAVQRAAESAVQRAAESAVQRCLEQSIDEIADKLLERLTSSLADLTPDQRVAVIAGLINATSHTGDGANDALSADSRASGLSADVGALVSATSPVSQEQSKASVTPLLGLARRLGIDYGDGVEYQRKMRSDY